MRQDYGKVLIVAVHIQVQLSPPVYQLQLQPGLYHACDGIEGLGLFFSPLAEIFTPHDVDDRLYLPLEIGYERCTVIQLPR